MGVGLRAISTIAGQRSQRKELDEEHPFTRQAFESAGGRACLSLCSLRSLRLNCSFRVHPHVHYLIPGGGLSLDERTWIASGQKFFLLHLQNRDRQPPFEPVAQRPSPLAFPLQSDRPMDPPGFQAPGFDPPLPPTRLAPELWPCPLLWLVPSGGPSPGLRHAEVSFGYLIATEASATQAGAWL